MQLFEEPLRGVEPRTRKFVAFCEIIRHQRRSVFIGFPCACLTGIYLLTDRDGVFRMTLTLNDFLILAVENNFVKVCAYAASISYPLLSLTILLALPQFLNLAKN